MANVKLTESKKKNAPLAPQKRVAGSVAPPKHISMADSAQKIREEKLNKATSVFVFRLDANGDRNFIATYPYPLAEGIIIEGLIQQLHGAGRYRVEYRNSKGQIVTTDEPLGVEGLSNVNAPTTTTQQPNASYAGLPMTPQGIESLVKTVMQQSKPVEPSLDQLLQTAKLLKELNGSTPPQKSLIEQVKELRELENLIAPKAEVKPAVETDPTIAVLKMLVKNPDSARSIQSNLAALFTGENPLPEKETSLADMVDKWLTALAPVVLPMLPHLLGNMQATPQVTTEQNAPVANIPTGTPLAPTPSSAPPQTLPANYLHLISRILFGIQNELNADFIAEEIELFVEKDQTLAPIIEQLLNNAPEQLLQGLASFSPQAAETCLRPNALPFITELLECFTEEAPEPSPDTVIGEPTAAGAQAASVTTAQA